MSEEYDLGRFDELYPKYRDVVAVVDFYIDCSGECISDAEYDEEYCVWLLKENSDFEGHASVYYKVEIEQVFDAYTRYMVIAWDACEGVPGVFLRDYLLLLHAHRKRAVEFFFKGLRLVPIARKELPLHYGLMSVIDIDREIMTILDGEYECSLSGKEESVAKWRAVEDDWGEVLAEFYEDIPRQYYLGCCIFDYYDESLGIIYECKSGLGSIRLVQHKKYIRSGNYLIYLVGRSTVGLVNGMQISFYGSGEDVTYREFDELSRVFDISYRLVSGEMLLNIIDRVITIVQTKRASPLIS